MKIPERLLVHLTLFVQAHYHSQGFVGSASEVGKSCEGEAEWWLRSSMNQGLLTKDEQAALVCLCGRFGKHLSSFYLLEREVR